MYLDIIVGWYMGRGLLLEAMDEAKLSLSMSLPMKNLSKMGIGKSMLRSIMKRTIESSKLSLRRLI